MTLEQKQIWTTLKDLPGEYLVNVEQASAYLGLSRHLFWKRVEQLGVDYVSEGDFKKSIKWFSLGDVRAIPQQYFQWKRQKVAAMPEI